MMSFVFAIIVTLTPFQVVFGEEQCPYISSPDMSRPFGAKISQQEVELYDTWYATFATENEIYSSSSQTGWQDNRQEMWAWTGSYLCSSFVHAHATRIYRFRNI